MNTDPSAELNRRDFLKGGSFATLMTMLGGVELITRAPARAADLVPGKDPGLIVVELDRVLPGVLEHDAEHLDAALAGLRDHLRVVHEPVDAVAGRDVPERLFLQQRQRHHTPAQ